MLQILGYLFMIFHICFFILCAIGPYITNNIYYLSILILFYTLVYYNWYMLDECIFSRIEQSLTGKEYKFEDGKRKSFIVELFENIIPDKNIIVNIIVTIPLINTAVALWKIINSYKLITLTTSEPQN